MLQLFQLKPVRVVSPQRPPGARGHRSLCDPWPVTNRTTFFCNRSLREAGRLTHEQSLYNRGFWEYHLQSRGVGLSNCPCPAALHQEQPGAVMPWRCDPPTPGGASGRGLAQPEETPAAQGPCPAEATATPPPDPEVSRLSGWRSTRCSSPGAAFLTLSAPGMAGPRDGYGCVWSGRSVREEGRGSGRGKAGYRASSWGSIKELLSRRLFGSLSKNSLPRGWQESGGLSLLADVLQCGSVVPNWATLASFLPPLSCGLHTDHRHSQPSRLTLSLPLCGPRLCIPLGPLCSSVIPKSTPHPHPALGCSRAHLLVFGTGLVPCGSWLCYCLLCEMTAVPTWQWLPFISGKEQEVPALC
ncbi:platelet glycoprotein VI isoform X1 [Microcebus murinus]|uniref:platelet glycoprotein VI isoform X1 n=1 Tax=Microcebus murinus TaxID=30608 RepID=UPI003F6BA41B